MGSTTANAIIASTRKSFDALLADIGGLLADLTSQEQATEASEDEENQEARRVIDVELQRFWKGYYELKQRQEENALSVAVLALTKSGKSTLLNALLGTEVLPMNNVPETARICCITHDAIAREPVLRDAAGKILARGEAAVRTRLQQINTAARNNGHLQPQSLDAAADSLGLDNAWDGNVLIGGASSMLHISTPLVALDGYGPELGRVTLLDTPGPNEAGEEQLKFQVERLLEGVDCVLYLLDYTKLKTADEEGLFRRLRAINPQLVARLSSRLFFVINKVDACETSDGLNPEEVRNYVADLVTRQLGGAAASTDGGCRSDGIGAPGNSSNGSSGGSGTAAGSGKAAVQSQPPFRLHPEQVLLLSARNALMARLVLGGRASPDAMKRFQRLAFGAFGGMSLGGRSPTAGTSNEQVRAAAGCLLEGSGILELEGRVLTFLAAHAASVKLLATADDLTRLLAQVRNVALACRSCLHRNVAALQEQEGCLRAELAEAMEAFEDVRARTDAVQAEVVEEIKAHLNTLRRRLFTQIVQTLDTDARAPPPTGPAAGQLATSRWHRVREKFLYVFTSSCSTLPPQPRGAGPSLVPEARSRSREELQSLLLELHDDLMGQIHSEVYDFWGVLETCVASRHSELLSALNGHLAALSQRVEAAVSETLGVRLTAADIRLRPPSAEQLHSDVQELIEKGIRESTEKHIRVGARTTTERVYQHSHRPPSLCRWGGYWVEVPRTRTVVETYTATVYSLRPDEIANHFIGLVDGAVTASERALGAYVGTVVERQLEAAKDRIRDYGDRYLTVMSAALAASSRGAECRSSVLTSVEGYLARLDELVTRAEVVQRNAEGVVPGGAAGLVDEVEVYDEVNEEGDSNQDYPHAQQPQHVYGDQAWAFGEEGAEDVQQEPRELNSELQPTLLGIEPPLIVAGMVALPETLSENAGQAVATSSSSIPDIDDTDDLSRTSSAGIPADTVPVDIGAGLGCNAAATTTEQLSDIRVGSSSMVGAVAEGSQDVVTASLQRLDVGGPQAAKSLNGEQEKLQLGQPRALQPQLVSMDTPVGFSTVLFGTAACASASHTAMPFDYSRAFLEAMSSSEMGTGSKLEEPLTMIPLTVDSEGAMHGEGPMPAAATRGCESPPSGESEDWHIVGEEVLEASKVEARGKQ